VLAALWVLVQVLAWILLDNWMALFGVFIVSLMLVPVLATNVFDRRS